jgi:diguanylate cyclase (GGDEF)-like protein/PAS domain S-box-containing protein
LKNNIPIGLILQDELVTQTIMNNSEDTIYFKNLDSKFILNSKAHANQFHEKDVKDMVGKDDFDYFPDEFAQAALDDEKTIIETGRPILGRIEKWNKPDGDVVWFQAYKYPLYDREGNITGTWGTSRNITPLKRAEEELIRLNRELQEANQRLEILSTRDSLSGLYNHRHFFDSLNMQKNIELRQKDHGIYSEFSVLLVDIDYFKSVNDTYGHQAGDFVIKTLSNLLTQSTRLVDTCYRIGGDEFAIILMNTDVKNARKVAEKLRIQVEKYEFNVNDMNLKITISIGTASSSEAETVKELISLADSRLYNAKELGRNQIK